MNYTQFIIELLLVITSDAGIGIEEIALTEDECKKHWASGITPRYLYEEIWMKDAGNFYKF